MYQIKFGTDGWRAIIAKEYTVDNVARIAKATADWLNKKYNQPSIVIGYDCRFGGMLFAQTAISVFCSQGIHVLFDRAFTTTPMVSLATYIKKAHLGIVITASHNPPSYNGYKLKSTYGGPTIPSEIKEIESLIPSKFSSPILPVDTYFDKKQLTYIDFESIYIEYVKQYFDLNAIQNSSISIAYDAMYGAGQHVLPKLLPQAHLLRCIYNPSFNGLAPEPIKKNLEPLAQYIKKHNIDFGFANDGDADRIGVLNSQGKFIDAHHIILLLIHILHKYEHMTGKVVVAFSVSPRIQKLCQHYGLECQITKIGFKYICEIMKQEDVLVGGEESGGIAVKGHIPERDGIWDALLLLNHMVKTGKTLDQLIEEVYQIVGSFAYNRYDLHINESLKKVIINNCKKGIYTAFGSYNITHTEYIDGYKFFLEDEQTVMIRPSGTEPVLRVYGESHDESSVIKLLDTVKKELLP